jgi:PAS domain S-box-containing protein
MVVAFDQIPYTAGRLVLGETVILHRLQDLPPREKLDRTFFKGVLGNPSLLIPSTCGTTTSGVLAVVFPANSDLINDFRSQFAVLADILAAALERRSVETVKTDYQQRFEGLVMQAPVGIALENIDRQILFANPTLCSILGYSEAELLDKNNWQLGIEVSSQDLGLFQKLCSGLISEYRLDKRFQRRDGEVIWTHQTVSLLRTDSGSPPVVIVMLQDITNRKTLETQLQECDAELQRLSAGLIQGQETERRLLSQELHDDIGQRLSFFLISLSQIGKDVPADMSATHAQISELSQQAEELATAVHELSHQLHSSILQHLGLVAALEGLSHRAERQYHIAVDLQTHDIPVISYDAALCMFRVAQEALNNAVKHGKAPQVTIRLEAHERRLRLEVRDSGVGFETAKSGQGLGMLTMRERLRLLGGELAVQSSPGEGTRVIGSLPLSADESPLRT